ncbi:MAG: anti-sigma factor domain-containing protein, partial [Planctomycetia bacterium]
AVTVAWKAGEDPVIAAPGADLGDVVWSPSRQRGFMRIRGLAANDPGKEQYQLWIFDAERNADYPVDGGVFNVTADGEVVVPIDPRLPVGRATLFAVTVEKPGGVVVSTRERVPLLAAVQ